MGELIGFGGIPVVGGVIAQTILSGIDPATRSLTIYGLAVIGGLFEGAVLAWFQAHVLRDHFRSLNTRRWISVTAGAAAFAWACGMLAPSLDDVFGLSPTIQIAIWIPAACLILVSIGGAQAWALRGIIERPQRWLAANVCGWLAGLPWTFILPALLPDGTRIEFWIATFAVAGVLMGLTAGLVTGVFLLRLQPVNSAHS